MSDWEKQASPTSRTEAFVSSPDNRKLEQCANAISPSDWISWFLPSSVSLRLLQPS